MNRPVGSSRREGELRIDECRRRHFSVLPAIPLIRAKQIPTLRAQSVPAQNQKVSDPTGVDPEGGSAGKGRFFVGETSWSRLSGAGAPSHGCWSALPQAFCEKPTPSGGAVAKGRILYTEKEGLGGSEPTEK